MATGVQYGELNWFPQTQVWQVPLPDGDRGIQVTIGFMNMAADWGQNDPQIRQLALWIVSGVANNDTAGEIAAIFNWVKTNIRFRGELDETIQSPEVTLNFGAGDCDDFSVLLAALLGSIGYQWEFKTVARGTKDYKHVYVLVLDYGNGSWIPLDATVDESFPGWERGGLSRARTWRGVRGRRTGKAALNGVQGTMRPRHGYLVGMGDAAADISQVLQSATPLVIGETQAVEGYPVQGSYGTPSYGYSYLSNFGASPYQGNPYLQPTVPLTQRAWFWPVIFGLGVLAVVELRNDGGRR